MNNIAVLFFLLSIAGFIYNFFTALQSIAATSWPVVEGKVVSLELDSDYDDPKGVVHEPNVSYTYKVGMNEYYSTKFGLGMMNHWFRFESAQDVRHTVMRDPLQVYYHPRNPRKSVLLTGIRIHHVLQGLLFAVIVFVSGKFI